VSNQIPCFTKSFATRSTT